MLKALKGGSSVSCDSAPQYSQAPLWAGAGWRSVAPDCFMRDWRFIYLSAQFFCCSQGFLAHALLGRLVYFSMSYINISGIYIAPTADSDSASSSQELSGGQCSLVFFITRDSCRARDGAFFALLLAGFVSGFAEWLRRSPGILARATRLGL